VSLGTRKSFLVLFFKKEQKKKRFFFEKKKQKTFVCFGASGRNRTSQVGAKSVGSPGLSFGGR